MHEPVDATGSYRARIRKLSQTSPARDNVFGDDGGVHQIPAVRGSVATGFTVELATPV